jgi:methyltransferase (TIGR00027 family)
VETGQPSRTALGAAAHRAAHQVLEGGSIFSDPLAVRILGDYAETAVAETRNDPSKRRMRMFIAVRTRFAEDALAAAVARGASQLVVLGAGLDTFAYRNPFGEKLRVFEVDHPATQAWKRRGLAYAGISVPPTLTFAPIDFERETLPDGLAAAGFDPARQTFFTWLGVVPYLTEQAVYATLAYIAGLPGGAHVVFDYANPVVSEPGQEEYNALHRELAERVAKIGESFKSYYETDVLHGKLRTIGFREIEDLSPASIRVRFFKDAGGSLKERGGHIIRAGTVAAR